MQKLTKLFLVGLLLISFSANASNSNNLKKNNIEKGVRKAVYLKSSKDIDPQLLSRVYGYFKGQKFTLERIKKLFPELKIEVKKAEIEFNLSFNQAKKRITNELKSIMGENFDRYETHMMNEINPMLTEQKITKDLALNFIEEVKQRAKGKIESPVIETLLTYQFIENPSKEFTEGYTFDYSTKNHPKSKGVTINAKIPFSWKQKEGNRPNIIQKFISENGEGEEIILFMVKDVRLPNNYKITQKDLDDFFAETELKQMVPDGGQFISAKKIVIDNITSGELVYRLTQKRLDFSTTLQTSQYITIYDGKMIFLQAMVSAEKDESLSNRFKLFSPLFRQVANSLVFVDQY